MQTLIKYKRCEKLQEVGATLGKKREERENIVQEHTATRIRLSSPTQPNY